MSNVGSRGRGFGDVLPRPLSHVVIVSVTPAPQVRDTQATLEIKVCVRLVTRDNDRAQYHAARGSMVLPVPSSSELLSRPRRPG